MEKILLALSGGVDSSASALILKDLGYDVHAAVFIMSDAHFAVAEAARSAADELGIPLVTLDLRHQFHETVIVPFCKDYCEGRTPSPCVMCNPLVKFRALADLADSLGIDKIATGHYARITGSGNCHVIHIADCAVRDQSYMLYRLGEDILSRLVLPLEGLSKDQVRTIAASAGLSSSSSPDSEENCFITGEDYITYLERNGYHGPEGTLVLPDGRRVPHRGIHRYTVGQRKGLGVSYSQPLYVKTISLNGEIILCCSGGEYFSQISVSNTVISPAYTIAEGQHYNVKIRSAAKPAPATVSSVTTDGFTLDFDPPVRAACPGQSAVLYDGDAVVGGGVITAVQGT